MKGRPFVWSSAMSVVMLTALGSRSSAQSSVLSESRLIALIHGRVEVGDGRVIENGTIVIRNGIILKVGADIPVPTGAEIYDAKGEWVFPGFIDAYTTRGVKVADAEPNQDGQVPTGDYASASMRAANRKGIRPELEARNVLSLTDELLKSYRAAGFTTAVIAPAGSGIDGYASIVDLSGRPARDSVVVPKFALAISYYGDAPAANVYPLSLFGRIAQVRQALYDAKWLPRVQKAYVAGGTERPPSDPILEALAPVLSGEIPMMAEANEASQIDRALSLAAEFNVRTFLVGATEGFFRLDAFKRSGRPLILGLNYIKDPTETKPVPDSKVIVPPTAVDADSVLPFSEPADRLAERKRLYDRRTNNAAVLRDAGISFAFSTTGAPAVSDFLGSLRATVKSGLPREAALKALTSDSAKLLGLGNRLGSLEVGKIANIVVMSADFLDDKTKVKTVFVDGHRISDL